MGSIIGEGLIRSENIFFDEEYASFEDMVLQIGEFLVQEGYVYNTYPKAVIEREKKYPTGLETVCLPVGIPHTDREHVKKSVVTVIRPRRPIVFKDMGGGDEEIKAEIIFMLAIKEGKDQITVLSKLMSIFSNEEVLKQLKKSINKEEIEKILQSVLC